MRVLVVEDDTISRKIVAAVVSELGHECVEAADGAQGWEYFQDQSFDVVISDWFMPTIDGLELCSRIRQIQSDRYVYFILLTVAQQDGHALEAMENGVDDFLQKPLDPNELRVRFVVAQRITRLQQRVAENAKRLSVLEEQTRSRTTFAEMVGTSHSMQEIFRLLRLAGEADVSVLIQGESGTGKELAARAIHSLSSRASQPFITVNCAAVPDSVLESELFGHVKGAFTDAYRDKTGLFELAHRGTIFLDEIGDVSPLLQKKLLRVLEEKKLRPVGAENERQLDVRVVAATNRKLEAAVEAGEFRQDLYYRIRVFPVQLPPLRERRDDLPLLVEHFLGQQRNATGKAVMDVEPAALRLILDHDWPGNIRELRNAIEHGFVTVTGETLLVQDLPAEIRGTQPALQSFPPRSDTETDREAERVIAAVKRCAGNRTKAARELGISRVALWKKIRKLGIEENLPPTRARKATSDTSGAPNSATLDGNKES